MSAVTFEKNNIKYKSLTESFETETPSGRMVFQMMAVVNEMEHNQTAELISENFKFIASQGCFISGTPPLGYDLKPDFSGKRRTSTLVINEQEAMTIRLIFDLYTIVKGHHEPIISEEVWEKTLVRMKGDKKAVKKHNGFYPLTGILK